MTGTHAACLSRNQSRSYLNHLVLHQRVSEIEHKYLLLSTDDVRVLIQFSCQGYGSVAGSCNHRNLVPKTAGYVLAKRTNISIYTRATLHGVSQHISCHLSR